MAKSKISLKRRAKKTKYTKKRIVRDNDGGGVLDTIKSAANNTLGFMTGIAKSKYAITMLFNPSNIDRLVLKNHYFSDFLDHEEIQNRLYPGIPIEYDKESKRFHYKDGTDISKLAEKYIQNEAIYEMFVKPAKEIVSNNNALVGKQSDTVTFEPQFRESNIFTIVCIYIKLKSDINTYTQLDRDDTKEYLENLKTYLPIKNGDTWDMKNFNKYISNVIIGDNTVYEFNSVVFDELMKTPIDFNGDNKTLTIEEEYETIVVENEDAKAYFKSLEEMKLTSQLKNAMDKLMSKMKLKGGAEVQNGEGDYKTEQQDQQCKEIQELQTEYEDIKKRLDALIHESKCPDVPTDATKHVTTVPAANAEQTDDKKKNEEDAKKIAAEKAAAEKAAAEKAAAEKAAADEAAAKKNAADKAAADEAAAKKAAAAADAKKIKVSLDINNVKTELDNITKLFAEIRNKTKNTKGGEPDTLSNDTTFGRLSVKIGTAFGTIGAKYNDLEKYYKSVDYIRVDDAGLVDSYTYSDKHYETNMLVKFQDKFEVFYRYLHLFKYQLKRVFWTLNGFSALHNLVYLIKQQNVMLLNNPRMLSKYQEKAVAFFKAVATTRMVNPMNSAQLDEYTKLVLQGKETELVSKLEHEVKKENKNNANDDDNNANTAAAAVISNDNKQNQGQSGVNGSKNGDINAQNGGDHTSNRIYRKLKKYFDIKDPNSIINFKDTVFTPKYPKYAEMEAKYTIVLAISILEEAGKNKSDKEKRQIDVADTINTYMSNGIDVTIKIDKKDVLFKLSKPNMLLNMNLLNTEGVNAEIKTFNTNLEKADLYKLVTELEKYDYSSLSSRFKKAFSSVYSSTKGSKGGKTRKNKGGWNPFSNKNKTGAKETGDASKQSIGSRIVNATTNFTQKISDTIKRNNNFFYKNLNVIFELGYQHMVKRIINQMTVIGFNDQQSKSSQKTKVLSLIYDTKDTKPGSEEVDTSAIKTEATQEDLVNFLGQTILNASLMPGQICMGFLTNILAVARVYSYHCYLSWYVTMTLYYHSSILDKENSKKIQNILSNNLYGPIPNDFKYTLTETYNGFKRKECEPVTPKIGSDTLVTKGGVDDTKTMDLSLIQNKSVESLNTLKINDGATSTSDIGLEIQTKGESDNATVTNASLDATKTNNTGSTPATDAATTGKPKTIYSIGYQEDREKRMKLYLSHPDSYQFKINDDFVGKINSIEPNTKNLVDFKKLPYDVKTQMDDLDEVSVQFNDILVLHKSRWLGGERTDFNEITNQDGNIRAYKHNIQPLVKYTYAKEGNVLKSTTLKQIQDRIITPKPIKSYTSSLSSNFGSYDITTEKWYNEITHFGDQIYSYRGEVVGKLKGYYEQYAFSEKLKFWKSSDEERKKIFVVFDHKTIQLNDYYAIGQTPNADQSGTHILTPEQLTKHKETYNKTDEKTGKKQEEKPNDKKDEKQEETLVNDDNVDDTFTYDKSPLPPLSDPEKCYFYIVIPEYKNDCPDSLPPRSISVL